MNSCWLWYFILIHFHEIHDELNTYENCTDVSLNDLRIQMDLRWMLFSVKDVGFQGFHLEYEFAQKCGGHG